MRKAGKVFGLVASLVLALASTGAHAGQDILLASAARTSTNTGADQYASGIHCAHFVLNVTAVPGVETITPKIQGKDPLGVYYDLLVGNAIVATGTTVLKVCRGIAPSANTAAEDFLPDIYRVVITHSAAGSFTYSLTRNSIKE